MDLLRLKRLCVNLFMLETYKNNLVQHPVGSTSTGRKSRRRVATINIKRSNHHSENNIAHAI